MTSPAFQVIFNSFTLVAASEMGDKTQLLAFSLAARFRRPGVVLAGITVATLANHALAAAAGGWLSGWLSPQWLGGILGVSFIAFGFWALIPDSLPESASTEGGGARRGAFWTTVLLFFLAEMGDKTQFATLALGARYSAPVLVTAGTTLGMLAADGLAVFFGDRMAGKVQMKRVRWVSAALFFGFGAMVLMSLGAR